jgi:Host cell surface-exposed lipoprotein
MSNHQAPRRNSRARKILGAIAAAIVVIIVIAAFSSHGGSNTPASSASSPAAPAATITPGPTAPVNTQSPASNTGFTTSQESAIQDAASYLSSEPGFSKSGLIGQIKYDGFSRSLARFAVDAISNGEVSGLSVNWMQQAADDAKNYMQSEGGFSYSGLVQQLEYDGFTASQARYGARSVGL